MFVLVNDAVVRTLLIRMRITLVPLLVILTDCQTLSSLSESVGIGQNSKGSYRYRGRVSIGLVEVDIATNLITLSL